MKIIKKRILLIYLIGFFGLVGCINKNYYKTYKKVSFNEIDKKTQILIYEKLSKLTFNDGYASSLNNCHDLTKKCKKCTTYNDDEGMLGFFINRKPHIVITKCNDVYEVPITFHAKFYLIDDNYIYFPIDIPWSGLASSEKHTVDYYVDIKTLKFGVIELNKKK